MFADYGEISAKPKLKAPQDVLKRAVIKRPVQNKVPATEFVRRKQVNQARLAAIKAANQARAAANKKAVQEKAVANKKANAEKLVKQREFKLARMQKVTDRKVLLAQEATNRLKLKQDAADKKRDDIIALKNAGNKQAVDKAINEYNNQMIEIQKAKSEAIIANTDMQQAQQAQANTEQTQQPQQSQNYTENEQQSENTYVPQQQQQEYLSNEDVYYEEPYQYYEQEQQTEQYVPNEEAFNPESSEYANSEIPNEERQNDVNALSNAYNETPNYEAYSEQYDYADESGMSGFMDEVKDLYNTKIKAPAGEYLRAKAAVAIGQPKQAVTEEQSTSTGTIIASIVAASGIAYMLLKKRRR